MFNSKIEIASICATNECWTYMTDLTLVNIFQQNVQMLASSSQEAVVHFQQ